MWILLKPVNISLMIGFNDTFMLRNTSNYSSINLRYSSFKEGSISAIAKA